MTQTPATPANRAVGIEPELTIPAPRPVETTAAVRTERLVLANLLAGSLLLSLFWATNPVAARWGGRDYPPDLVAAALCLAGFAFAVLWAVRELLWREQRLLLSLGTPVVGTVAGRVPAGETGTSRVTFRFSYGDNNNDSATLDANDSRLDAHGLVEGAAVTVLVHPYVPWSGSRAYCTLGGVRVKGCFDSRELRRTDPEVCS